MAGVNKVILIGSLGNDPDARTTPAGTTVTTISIATSEKWKDKQTGQQQERTEWHRVICFNRLGEIAGEYLRKGSKVYIEGQIRTRKWQDRSGVDRYTTEIVARELQMLDSRQDNGSQQQSRQSNAAPQQNRNANQGATGQQGHTPQYSSPDDPFIYDDDIPF